MKSIFVNLLLFQIITLAGFGFAQTIPVSESQLFAASSVLKASNVANYNPSNVFDFTQSTAWVEGAKGSGVGEWVALYLGKLEKLGDISDPVITIFPGYQKDGNSYTNNNIPSSLKIELFVDNNRIGSTLIDNEKEHFYGLVTTEMNCKKGTITKGIVWLKVTILKVQKGKKWDDTAISEIYCNFKNANPHMIKESINRFCQGVIKKNAAVIKEFTNESVKRTVDRFTSEFDPEAGPSCSNEPIICSEGVVYLHAVEGGDGASYAKFVLTNGKWKLKGFNYFINF